MCSNRLPLYLFKCTSDKSSIQSGQGLPRVIALYTPGLSTLVYSHLPTRPCHCGLPGCLLPALQLPLPIAVQGRPPPCAGSQPGCVLGQGRKGRGRLGGRATGASVPVQQIKNKTKPHQLNPANGKPQKDLLTQMFSLPNLQMEIWRLYICPH